MVLILQILKEIGKALLLSLLSRKMVESLIIYFLEWLSKKTDNEVDDNLVKLVKEALRPQVAPKEEAQD